MNKSKSNKPIFSSLLIGMVIGAVVVSVAGVSVYQKATGKNVLNHISYLVDQGKKYVQSLWEQTAVRNESEVNNQDSGIDSVLHLTVNAQTELRPINPLIYGSNLAGKAEFEMHIAQFARELGITSFRFPGGGSSGYRWKTGNYDFSDRYDNAPLSEIGNLIKFSDIAGAQLVIQVNVESGSAQEAAEWVAYMNKGEGKSRVDYWELGNEVYGDWDRAFMSGDEYAKLIKEYAVAMKQVDPTIKIGANWGGPKYQAFDKAVIKGAADHIDFVSYHWYPNHVHKNKPYQGRTHPRPADVMANSMAVEKFVNRFKTMVSEYAPHRKNQIEFTVMEWDGSWDAVPSDLDYEYKGIMWSLANAIFYADTLGQFAHHGITVANLFTFQEVMFGIIRGWDKQAGWGGSSWDGKTIRPKGLALKLFARYFGDTLVSSQLKGSPSYYKEADWRADSHVGKVPFVASYVSKSSKDNTISIVFTNKHANNDFKVNITLNNVVAGSEGSVWILNGPGLKSQNDGSPGKVDIKKYELSGLKNKFSYNIPAHSVSLLKIPYNN